VRSALLVASVAIIVYASSLRCGFAFDDNLVIERNQVVQHGTLREIFAGEYWGTIAPLAQSHGYRPLTILTLRLNHAVGGLAPWGYHLFNVLAHAGVCVLVLALARRLGLPPIAAACAALLFATHAVHTEAVTGIVGRAELLAAAAVLGALLLHDSQPAWACLVFLCGLLSKENAIVFPLLAAAWDWLRRRSLRWPAYAGYAIAVALFLGTRVAVTGHWLPTFAVTPLDNPLAHVGIVARWLTAISVLGRYAWLLIAPVRLSADYGLGAIPILHSPLDGYFFFGLLAFGSVAFCTIHFARRAPALAFSLLVLIVTIAPVANLLTPIHTIMGERLLYLPSVGFCLALAWLLRGCMSLHSQPLALAAFGALIVAHGVRTWLRNPDWNDNVTLFAAAYEVTPNSARVANNHGNVLKLRGQLEPAIDEYRRATAIYPDYTDAYQNWMLTSLDLGRPQEAARAAAGAARAMLRLGYPQRAAAAARDARRYDPALDLSDIDAALRKQLGR
jgi:protein O-mannosyl-transferase